MKYYSSLDFFQTLKKYEKNEVVRGLQTKQNQ